MEEQKQDNIPSENSIPTEEKPQPVSGEVVQTPSKKNPNALASTLEEALEKAKSQGTSLIFFGIVCIFLGTSFLLQMQGGFTPFAPILWVIGIILIILGIQVRKKPFIRVFLFQGLLTVIVGLIFLLPFNRTQHSGDLFDLIIGAMATAQGVLWVKEYLRYREL